MVQKVFNFSRAVTIKSVEDLKKLGGIIDYILLHSNGSDLEVESEATEVL